MLSLLQRAIALAVSAAVLAAIPGQPAYAALAREVVPTPAPAARMATAVGLVGAVPSGALVSTPRLPMAPMAPSVPGDTLPALPAAAVSAAVSPVPVRSALSAAAAAAAAVTAGAAAAPKAGRPAALPQARAAEATLAGALARPGAPAGSLRAAAGAAFDASALASGSEADDAPLASPSASIAALAPASSAAAGRPARRVPAVAAAHRWLGSAAAVVAARPFARTILAVAAIAAAAVVMPHTVSALALPLVMGTCNAMRERAIKNATILPRNQQRSEVAKTELDRILVEFGKRVKEQADADERVTTEISAHSAEHAMEEPLLEVLPELKGLWASGAKTTKDEALAQMKAAVLEELRRRFPNESPEVVEELFEKTGAWKEILDWEARHQILDELKKAAQETPHETLEQLKQIREQEQGGRSQTGQGAALLGVALIAGLTLAHVALGPAVAAGVGLAAVAGVLSGDAQPPQPPVALDTYLASLGLSKEEADLLKGFTIDLGARDMAPVIGRSKELRRAITILSKPAGTQNNPMILGDKGVGKTAIVEAVARYLYQNRLPSLQGKRILELDTGKLMAGAGAVGEMEKRLTALRTILAKTDNKVILFVDEIHSILKNVSTANSVPDLLKSPLRNGEITVIGATTVGEYRKYLEQDPAFADRFDTIQVNEPSEDEAVEMLEGDLEYLERKFGVTIDPEAARAAVKLSSRYIPEKFLPRKARQLLESAIADAKPEATRDGLQVQIDQLTDRLRLLVRRYADLKKRNAPRPEEVAAYNRVVDVYATILSLEDQRGAVAAETIGKAQIVRTLAKETGIPVGDVDGDEYERLMRMEPWFKERIVNQDDAIKALADAVRTNKAGLSDPNRPQGVFLFAGKTGVGKTALTRALAEYLFSDPDAVTRLDMSEYMEKFAVQRLFGAPPGYVGYDAGGELTEKVRRKPYQVVLFDEIEKAHPDVLNALLQVFDAGRMTDGRQNTVNFKNTIIIMTTNLGAKAGGEGEEFKRRVVEQIRQRLTPEFYNRIDKTVVFNPLDVRQAEAITAIMLKDVEKRLREQDLDLRVSPEALKLLAAKGFDPELGARPLKRVVETEITNALSPFLLAKRAAGELANGGVVEVTAQDVDLAAKTGRIRFELRPNPPVAAEPAPLPDGPLGDKLRRILEQASAGEGVAKDMESFESALFPERRAVTLDAPLGAFHGDEPPASAALQTAAGPLSNATPGVKDAALNTLKATLAPTWGSPAVAEAADTWLTAFSRAAKELSPRDVPRIYVGERSFVIEADADAGYAARQKLARKALEHFSQALPDEAAVRARASALKDEGREADLAWLEVKRAVEAVPGAQFGWSSDEENGGRWRFWLTLPQVAGPAKAEEPAEPSSVLLDETRPAEKDKALGAARRELDQRMVSGYSIPARTLVSAFTLQMVEVAKAKATPEFPIRWSYSLGSDEATITVSTPGKFTAEQRALMGTFIKPESPMSKMLAEVGGAVSIAGSSVVLRVPATRQADGALGTPEPPVPTSQARATPAKMFLFLTQRGPKAMAKRRALIAEMLDSKSTQVRLTGLLMAADVLPAGAWRELAASVRMLRLDDVKDYALFAALVERHPESPMTAQRKALADTYESALRSLRGQFGYDRYSSPNGNNARLYAKLAAPSLPPMQDSEAREAQKIARQARRSFLILLGRCAAWAAIASGAIGTVAYWMGAPVGFLEIVALASGGIALWTFLAKFRSRRDAGRLDAALYEAANFARLPEKARLSAVRRWLDGASRGTAYFDEAEEAAMIAAALPAMSEGEKLRLFGGWRSRLERALARVEAKPSSNSPAVLSTMGLLARLLPYVPDAERQACARALLQPLRRRWLPQRDEQYLEGLGAWAAAAPIPDEQLDELLNLVMNFPSSDGGGMLSFVPVLQGIARRPSLPPSVAAGLEQSFGLVAGDAADGYRSRTGGVLELARLCAKQGVAVWPSLRGMIEDNADLDWKDFRDIDRLIAEAPPSEKDRAWLSKALTEEDEGDKSVNAAVALALARLNGGSDETLAAALRALQERAASTDPSEPALDPSLLEEIGALAGSPLADKDVRAAWESAVGENSARLQAK